MDEGALIAALPPGISLYVVRHGETDWNREARYQGQRDIPLNNVGRLQARRHGAVLKSALTNNPGIDFISSPLSRALETMRIMRTEMALDPDTFLVDPELREVHYGHWEGRLLSELPAIDPDGIAAKARDPFRWRPKDGESYEDLQVRIARWLSTVKRDTVAVTHGGVSRVLRGALFGLDAGDIPFLDCPQERLLVIANGEMSWL